MIRFLSKNYHLIKANGIGSLLFGSLTVQIVSLISMPIIFRLYNAEAIGTLAIFSNFLTVPSALICLKYENAIFQIRKKELLFPLISLCIYILLTISIFSSLFFLFCWYNHILGIDHLPLWSVFGVFFILVATGIALLVRTLYVYDSRFVELTRINIERQGLNSVIKIIGGILKGGFFMLVIAEFLCIFKFITSAKEFGIFKVKKFSSLSRLKQAIGNAKTGGNYLLFESSSTLLDQLSLSLPILYIGQIFRPNDVAVFTLAFGLVFLGSKHLGYSSSEFFRSKFSTFYRDSNYTAAADLFLKVLRNITLMSIAVSIALFFLGPTVIRYLFSEKWNGSVEIFEYMIPWAAVSMVSSTLSPVFTIMGKQKLKLVYDLLSLFLLGIVLILCDFKNIFDYTVVISLVCLITNLIYLLLYYFIYNDLKKCVVLQ
jgi:O-antigen/teichoic acid export membrane protein